MQLQNLTWRRLCSRQWRWTLLIAAGGILILFAWLGFGTNAKTQFDLTRHSVPLDQIVDGGPGKDGIPAILAPRFVPASEAMFLQDTDHVLGLTLEKEATAYPIKVMNWHEVVNDKVGNTAVVVTYCPLCGTGIAFDAEVAGGRHTFGVSGLLYQSDLLMYDHQTESLWSQIGMHAVAGPLTGEKLRPIFLEHTTWGDWRTAHPTTRVLSDKTGWFRNYDRDPYAGYAQDRNLFFDTTHFNPDYHPKEWVVGIELQGSAKAYPFAELKNTPSPLSDEVGGHPVTIHFDPNKRSASVIDAEGRPVSFITAFWFAWYAFHPSTQVFKAN